MYDRLASGERHLNFSTTILAIATPSSTDRTRELIEPRVYQGRPSKRYTDRPSSADAKQRDLVLNAACEKAVAQNRVANQKFQTPNTLSHSRLSDPSPLAMKLNVIATSRYDYEFSQAQYLPRF